MYSRRSPGHWEATQSSWLGPSRTGPIMFRCSATDTSLRQLSYNLPINQQLDRCEHQYTQIYSATSSLLMESGGSRQRTPPNRTHRGTSITISIRPIIRRCPRMLSRVSPAPVRRSVLSWRIKRTKLWSPSSSLTKPHQSYRICSLHALIWM